jgi:hypothetical protein
MALKILYSSVVSPNNYLAIEKSPRHTSYSM